MNEIIKELEQKAIAARRVDVPEAQRWGYVLDRAADFIRQERLSADPIWNYLDTNFSAAKAIDSAGTREESQVLYDMNFTVIRAMAGHEPGATNDAVRALLTDAINNLEEAPVLTIDGLRVALYLLQNMGDVDHGLED